MTQMLELFDNEFKEAIIKMPQCTITNMLDVIKKWKVWAKKFKFSEKKKKL